MRSCLERIQNNEHQLGANKRYATLFGNLNSNEISQLSIASYEGYETVDIKDIMYLKADVNYTNVYLNNGMKFLVAKTLKKYEEMLPSHLFCRVHKTYMVNKMYVKRVVNKNEALILDNEVQINIALRRRKAFYQFMNQ